MINDKHQLVVLLHEETSLDHQIGSSNKVFRMNPFSYEALELVPGNGDSFAFNLEEILKLQCSGNYI